MVRLSKAQIKEGIRAYRNLAEEKADKLGTFLIDLLESNPNSVFSITQIQSALKMDGFHLDSSDFRAPFLVELGEDPLRTEIKYRLEEMVDHGIVESKIGSLGDFEYILKEGE